MPMDAVEPVRIRSDGSMARKVGAGFGLVMDDDDMRGDRKVDALNFGIFLDPVLCFVSFLIPRSVDNDS